MKINKPWSWIVSAIVVITAPVWVVPVLAFIAFQDAVVSFHKIFFKE